MVLTHAELRQALEPNPGMVDSSMVHAFSEVRNQRVAIDFIKQEAKARQLKYNLTLVKKLYEILYSNLPNRMPITFRRDMPLHRTYFHDIVQPVQIQPALEQLFHFMDTEEFHRYHPFRQATVSHHRFMEIFPFSDLSGKVGRMCTNLILLRHNYLPCIIHSIDRQKYYEAFRGTVANFRTLLIEISKDPASFGSGIVGSSAKKLSTGDGDPVPNSLRMAKQRSNSCRDRCLCRHMRLSI